MIVESATSGLLVLHQKAAEDPWTATALTVDDRLSLPELGVEIPVAEIYENVRFAD